MSHQLENRPVGWVRSFVDVRADEIGPALLFFLQWFSIVLVFQVLKPLKKGLFVEHLGAYIELYAKLANIGVAILAVIGFTLLYNRLGSRRLMGAMCGFFTLVLLGFAAVLDGEPSPVLNWTFYLFGDAWTTVWVTTFWAYLNEMTHTGQAKRLYGLIGGGGIVGGLVGGLVVWRLVQPLGTPVLLLGCAVTTLMIGLIAWQLERLAAQPGAAITRRSTDRLHVKSEGREVNVAMEGARLVTASKYLFAIAATVLLYELVSQILDYQYATAAESLEGAGATQAFFGQVTAIIGIVSIVTQFFLVSFIIRTFGMTTALLVLPAALAASSGIYFAVPVLTTAALLTISDNGLSYSINQTARETLFMPTSADVKYKARAFANMFVQRFGKGVAVLMALALGMVPIRYLSLLALAVMIVWAIFAIYAGRRFDELTGKREEEEFERAPATVTEH